MKKRHHRSSELLKEIIQDESLNGTITYQELFASLGERTFGIVLLFFAIPSALPFSFIPGVSVIFTIPLVFCALQIIFGQQAFWLPDFIANRTISKTKVVHLIEKILPYLRKVEYLLQPRLEFMFNRVMEIIIGIAIFGLALLLMLPIPFSNFIIAALIMLFGLGLVEKDGLLIILGFIGAIVYVAIIYGFFALITTVFA